MADTRAWWRQEILIAQVISPLGVRALTPLRRLKGSTHPVLAYCDDGRQYVVKGRDVMRPLIADQIVGHLGALIGAPVPATRLVDIPEELVTSGSFFEGVVPGIGHGSEFLPGCEDSRDIRFSSDTGNQERYAALAVLFGWIDPEDRQYLFTSQTPHTVWSIDHGMFLCGSDEWTIDTLVNAPEPDIDRLVAVHANVSQGTITTAVRRLEHVTNEEIVRIVAMPPDDWGISLDERVALAQYLASRRDSLLASFASR